MCAIRFHQCHPETELRKFWRNTRNGTTRILTGGILNWTKENILKITAEDLR